MSFCKMFYYYHKELQLKIVICIFACIILIVSLPVSYLFYQLPISCLQYHVFVSLLPRRLSLLFRFQGDGNIRYFEMVQDAPYCHFLNQYLSSSPQRGLGRCSCQLQYFLIGFGKKEMTNLFHSETFAVCYKFFSGFGIKIIE